MGLFGGRGYLLFLVPSESLEWRPVYRLLTALVQPRPIAWVSTKSAEGIANLAPFSFFNVVCANPATIAFSPMWSGPEALKKDTLANIEETGEFVVQVVSRELSSAMNVTSCEVSHEVDEFELAGLRHAPSRMVEVPRVEEAQAYLECRLDRIIEIGEGSGAGALVLGQVICIEVDDEIMDGERVDLEKLDPIGRLSGSDYCGISDRFHLGRPSPEELSRPKRK